jgi:hypothetical protein
MRCLSASELVNVWESGLDRHPVARALSLLSCCCDESRGSLAALPIGRRDALLFDMYERLFGPAMDAFAECPACSEPLEYSLVAAELRGPGNDVPGDELILNADGFRLHLRLPNSEDVERASGFKDLSVARRFLLESCIAQASHAGSPIPSAAVPDSLSEEIEARITQADPQTEILIHLCCSACQHSWQVLFDVERFLWVKFSALAKRLLREVHTLARAYGWSEADILSLSASRRQAYLEMVSA